MAITFSCHSPFPEKLDPVFVPVLMVLLGRLTTNLFLEKKNFFFAEAKELGPFFPMTFSCKNQQAFQYERNRYVMKSVLFGANGLNAKQTAGIF